ncbi:MAG: DUF4292 domain-containing protein [Prosthecochloris sp.]|nr:DUF4292 domain-containing protein [Prosthecochloris sp.]
MVAVMLTGCADFKTVTVEEWPAERVEFSEELADLYRDVSKASGVIDAVEGYADIWIKTPKREKRVYSNIQLEKERTMRIIVSSGILGWPVADMHFRPDSLYVHDMLNNVLLVGSNHPDNLEKILGVRSGYELFSNALTGMIPMNEPLEAVQSVHKSGSSVSFSVVTPSGKKAFLVNQVTRNMEGVIISDAFGRKQVEMHFRNFSPHTIAGNPVDLPKEINLLMYNPRLDGGGRHELVIVYDERTINPENLRIQYRIPQKARVIELDRVGILPWM